MTQYAVPVVATSRTSHHSLVTEIAWAADRPPLSLLRCQDCRGLWETPEAAQRSMCAGQPVGLPSD